LPSLSQSGLPPAQILMVVPDREVLLQATHAAGQLQMVSWGCFRNV